MKKIMQFFRYEHLPPQVQFVSKKFCELADWVEDTLPNNDEKAVALRKVLEAKDAAVRSAFSV